MESVDIQAVESKLSDVTVTAVPMGSNKAKTESNLKPQQASTTTTTTSAADLLHSQSKYGQLLAVIEEIGREVHPTYAGSRSSAERLKRGIVQARILVKECLIETERSARQ